MGYDMNDDLVVAYQIEQQCAKYAFSWDARDIDGWLSVFADEGVFELYLPNENAATVIKTGTKELRAFAKEKFAAFAAYELIYPNQKYYTNHCQSSLILDSHDKARVESRIKVIVPHLIPPNCDKPIVVFSGAYHDIWERDNGEWKIINRTFRP